ncbi:MAG: hypothetical protein QF464_23815, partial [Myxococcota bacterium]|nr:hypothetical protein [Myxococcota bacterium]
SDAVEVHAHEHMYGYHYALNRGTSYSGFHSFYGRHARWRSGKEIPYPGRQVRAFLRGPSVCEYDYLLARTKRVPRWRKLADRVTYVDHSAKYSLWKLETDRIPACTEAGSEDPAKARVASTRPAAVKAKVGTLASTLAPKVGRARGRNLAGEWKQRTPKPRPLPPAESEVGPKADVQPPPPTSRATPTANTEKVIEPAGGPQDAKPSGPPASGAQP